MGCAVILSFRKVNCSLNFVHLALHHAFKTCWPLFKDIPMNTLLLMVFALVPLKTLLHPSVQVSENIVLANSKAYTH